MISKINLTALFLIRYELEIKNQFFLLRVYYSDELNKANL